MSEQLKLKKIFVYTTKYGRENMSQRMSDHTRSSGSTEKLWSPEVPSQICAEIIIIDMTSSIHCNLTVIRMTLEIFDTCIKVKLIDTRVQN